MGTTLTSMATASPLLGMFGLGPMEMIVVGIVALLLFGSNLPSAMRGLGQGIREFKDGMNDTTKEIEGK